MKKVSLLFGLILILSTSCKDYRLRRGNSFDQIEFLKEHSLLVRLKTTENKVKSLKKLNEHARAKAVAVTTKFENQQIMQAFTKHFDFCKVYFFRPEDTKALRARNFDEVTLINSDNQTVSDKSILRNGFLVSSFDFSYDDELVHEDQKQRVSVGGTNSFEALVIMDTDYVQLKRPFPSKVALSLRKDYKFEAVKELNKDLYNFYHKAQIKKAKFKRRRLKD